MKQILKRLYFRAKYHNSGVKISRNVDLYANTIFEGNNYVGENSIFGGHLGRGSYIGSDCAINADIGKYTCIANKVCVVQGSHPTHDFVSVHPAFFSKDGKCGLKYVNHDLYTDLTYANDRGAHVVIGNDVWIGYRATIIAGVKIGDGAIIGSNSLVLHDVPAYSIVAGIPAKQIGMRFDEFQIRRLESEKWWDYSVEQVRETISNDEGLVQNVDAFLNALNNSSND